MRHIDVHINQIRRYEAGATQPSLDALKKLATSMNVTIDSLVFGEGERDPTDDLRLQLEAVSRMPEEEREIVKALLEGMMVKYQTKQLMDGLSSQENIQLLKKQNPRPVKLIGG